MYWINKIQGKEWKSIWDCLRNGAREMGWQGYDFPINLEEISTCVKEKEESWLRSAKMQNVSQKSIYSFQQLWSVTQLESSVVQKITYYLSPTSEWDLGVEGVRETRREWWTNVAVAIIIRLSEIEIIVPTTHVENSIRIRNQRGSLWKQQQASNVQQKDKSGDASFFKYV